MSRSADPTAAASACWSPRFARRAKLVTYLSDNGRAFPGAKTTRYDEGIHLPLIIAAPDAVRLGVRNEAMVSWIDIVPTILNLQRPALRPNA